MRTGCSVIELLQTVEIESYSKRGMDWDEKDPFQDAMENGDLWIYNALFNYSRDERIAS